jgi:peptide/nickel transport system substrate-binding protein
MTDERLKTLETIGKLVSEGKLDRRKLFQTASALWVTGALGGASLAVTASSAAAQDSDLKLVTISQEQQATWIKNFNPLLAEANSRWPTQAGMFEPMAIYSTPQGKLNPWLADSWEFSEDLLTLTFKMHPGINWSDGTPLTAQDVKFTFDTLIANDGLSGTGAIRTVLPRLASIEAPDDATVVFTFKEVFTLNLYDIAEQMIVPKHIWETVDDPVAFLNDEKPVGSGPFTEIGTFEAQYWELHKNPSYWQEGKPAIDGFRFPSYPTNDAANLATLNGENDWTANFIPDIENTFVSKDPEHFHYWFPSYGATVHLWLNTTVAPFDKVEVRKAISQAVDREQIVAVAMYDYTHPADSSGLSDAFPAFKTDDDSTKGEWVTMDVDAANAALDAAGLTKDGDTRSVDGTAMEYELLVVTGWSDWVASCEIMAQNLADVGIKATVTPLDYNAWYDKVTKGDFTMSIGWSDGGATPYSFYLGCMSSTTVKPVGTLSPQNWQRFGSEEADALLTQMAATSDIEEQKTIVAQLQELYNQNAPGVPLFPGPQWGEYITLRFDGFPNEDNPYAILSTYDNPERLTVMTTIAPVAES